MNLRQQIENNQKVLLFAIIGLLLLFSLWGQRPFTANGSTVELVNQDEPSVNNQNANEPTAQENQILEDIPVLNDTGLSPDLNPLTFENSTPLHQFVTYTVVRGDTPNIIADRFNISPETILGGNPQLSEESSLLQIGTDLIILPIDGVLHTVQPGESIEDLQLRYGIPIEEIVAYEDNNLSFPYRLEPETQIVVPGAVRELFVWTPPDLSSVGGTSSEGSGVTPIIVGTGTYVFPVNSRNYTQFFWFGHPGLDIALVEGSAVFASDTGTVTFAGWNNFGYGNLIVVNHGNGFETFYAHLSGINVVPGQIVNQGNVIGASGNTGNSSGPHIHFEIRFNNNRDNPCWYIGC
ncbi:MAG: peptidoglycan DD-metalloendopeptidase family protein [Chloroflexota bacterium]